MIDNNTGMRNSIGALLALSASLGAIICTGVSYGFNQTDQRIVALTLPPYPHSSIRQLSSSWDEAGSRGVVVSQQIKGSSNQALIYYLPWLQTHHWEIKEAKVVLTTNETKISSSFDQLKQLLSRNDIYAFTITFTDGHYQINITNQTDDPFTYTVT